MKPSFLTWREYLISLCEEQLDSHDQEAALEEFDEMVELGESNEEDIFNEVCTSFDIEIEE